MMTPGIKAKWLEALRSGKYAQGIKLLRTQDEKYCCLGVLCDIMNPTGWHLTSPQFDTTLKGTPCYAQGKLISTLGGSKLKEAGINVSQQMELISMNDSGKSFAEIADHIERKL